MRVETILSVKGRSVVTIEDSCTLREAAQALDANAIGALVAVDPTGRPIAVLTERDVVRELAMHGRASLNRTVANATTPAFVTAVLDDTVEDILLRMTDRRVRHLPVLDGRELVGIVSIGDAVKAKIEAVEAQTAAMREYILS